MTRQPYTYRTLRYVHDIQTGEFLNVGVVLHVATATNVLFRIRKTFSRAKALFPDLDGEAFRGAMAAVDRALLAVPQNKDDPADGCETDYDVSFFAHRALPADDSTLQWSLVGSGITDDPAKTLDRLYSRLVARYDSTSPARRSDADVWRPVREKLQQRAIKIDLEEKVVIGTTDEISFKHAWRNGSWHAYEALSLDLADAENIKDKARRWRGHLDAVAAGGTTESVQLNFIVGAPQGVALEGAYRRALDILRQASFKPKVFEDNQINEMVDEIEDEVRGHRDGVRA